MIKSLIWVGLGGSIGSMFRFYIGHLFSKMSLFTHYPIGTFMVNVIGCFIAGFLSEYLGKNGNVDPTYRYILISGFCGGFTTFSALGLESMAMMESGRIIEFLGYTLLSIVVGFGACFIGMYLGR